MDLVSTPQFIWMWTNEENVVVKDRNKNAQRFLLIKNVGKIKNVKKRVFYFKIKNVKNVFNIYASGLFVAQKNYSWRNLQPSGLFMAHEKQIMLDA